MTKTVSTKYLHNQTGESPMMTKEEYNGLEWGGLASIEEICDELEGTYIESAMCSVRNADKGKNAKEIIAGLMLNIRRKDGTTAVLCFESDENNSYPCYTSIAERTIER